MIPAMGTCLRAALLGCACLAAVRPAVAETRRVAAVDPDAQLARAVEIALSAWGTTIVEVHLDTPGATMPIALEKARAIAEGAHADVAMWVSAAEGGYALWIYDVASDHASARTLASSPPFDPASAAAIALTVKTLLRGTVVAPPPERFGVDAREEPTWIFGASAGAAARSSASWTFEGRVGLHASVWPRALGGRWGTMLELESGTGLRADTDTFSGTLTDTALRIGVGARIPLARDVVLEPSLGGGVHLVSLDGTVLAGATHASITSVDGALEPRVALGIALWGARLQLAPWMGLSLLTRWQRFLVHGDSVLELGPVALEGALRAALTLP